MVIGQSFTEPSPPILRCSSAKMAATRGEDSEDKSISMRVALFGIRNAFPSVKQMDTGDLAKFIQGNKYKNLILLVSITVPKN
jgi:hypothetical protein